MRELSTWVKFHEQHPLVILGAGAKTPLHKNWPKRSVSLFEVQKAFRDKLNLGIRCDNLTVIDFDAKEPAREFFRKYESVIKIIVETRRGIHFYFARAEMGNKQNREFDVRSGPGGYVVAPGSVVQDHLYKFVPGFELSEDLGQLPKELLNKLETPTGTQQKFEQKGDMVARAVAYVESIPGESEGNRDNKLFYVACKLLGFGLSKDQAYPILLAYNQRCEPPVDTKRIFRKLEEAERKASA